MVLARANATSLFDGGLTNGVTYYYEVAATNSIGEGPRSAPVPATPKASGLGTDTIKPSIQILSPVAGASLPAGPTVVTGNASDNVGLALVRPPPTPRPAPGGAADAPSRCTDRTPHPPA